MSRATSATSTPSAAASLTPSRRRPRTPPSHPAEHHDAVHADHVGQQGARPRRPFSTRSRTPSARRCGRHAAPMPRARSCRRRTSCSTISTRPSRMSAATASYRFNERQLLYVSARSSWSEPDEELTISNFKKHHHRLRERARRNPRHVPGAARLDHHPHRDETITLGTLTVERLRAAGLDLQQDRLHRKRRLAEALKAARWGERHDCAMMSSKGFSTRAARDLIDKLAEHDEPVTVFCVHDADASGTMIYQTLQEATKARGARKIQIVNLGLEPWEAIAMGLEVETSDEARTRKPVADYVRRRRAPTADWEEWLQTHRDRTERDDDAAVHRVARRQDGRAGVLQADPADRGHGAGAGRAHRGQVRAAITERILREAGSRIRSPPPSPRSSQKPGGAELAKGIERLFKREQDRQWRDHVEAVASPADEAAFLRMARFLAGPVFKNEEEKPTLNRRGLLALANRVASGSRSMPKRGVREPARGTLEPVWYFMLRSGWRRWPTLCANPRKPPCAQETWGGPLNQRSRSASHALPFHRGRDRSVRLTLC